MKIANVTDIPLGKTLVVQVPDGREIALFNIEGNIYALDNTCPHMGGPLGEGELEGSCITCPWHGWQFDVKTGLCSNMPGEDATSIQIEIKNGEVFINP